MKMCHLSVPQALLPQDFHMLSQERGPAAPSTHLLFANVASECNLRAQLRTASRSLDPGWHHYQTIALERV